MENKKEQSTASSLLRFAGPYKGKYILSIFLSVLGVASGLVPYYAKILFLDPFHQRFTYCYLSCAPGCAETDC